MITAYGAKAPEGQEDKKTLILEGAADPIFWLRYFLSDWFPTPMPWVHRAIVAIILRRCDFLEAYGDIDLIIEHFVWTEEFEAADPVEHPVFYYENNILCMNITKYTAVMLPRGFSKTTLLNGIVLYMIYNILRKFPMYISESGPHAEQQASNVKNQIETNEKLNMVYGVLKPENSDRLHKWRSDIFQTLNGVTVKSVGRGGQIRGANVDAVRPDLILVDDVQDEDSVESELQRKKDRRWFFGAVEGALPINDPEASMVILGTLLHGDALMVTIANDPRFNFIRFGALDRHGDPLWSYKMNGRDLEIKKLALTRAGELDTYYKEYESKLVVSELQKFKQEYFRYAADPGIKPDVIALAVDPAISARKKADFFSIAVVGMCESTGMITVLEAWGAKGVTPREQINKIFELFKLWRPLHVGIEAVAYQAALVHLVREEMFRKKLYFPNGIKPITHTTEKIARVEGVLSPRYASGYIQHRIKFPLLESQLLVWPGGKKDLPDAVAMAVTLLDPFAAFASDLEQLAEDEYRASEDTLAMEDGLGEII
ncbi:MAG: hypothetical protein L3J79_06620 [Candidatus Marinimicrobia bacterium]|nr:hypothetical protein [Candidatus Neomarinimicrobiota bacterium]